MALSYLRRFVGKARAASLVEGRDMVIGQWGKFSVSRDLPRVQRPGRARRGLE